MDIDLKNMKSSNVSLLKKSINFDVKFNNFHFSKNISRKCSYCSSL